MIASVTEEGIVSAIAIGEATITISVDGKSAQFTLTVEKIAVESVTLPDEWKDGYTMPLSGTLELAGKAACFPRTPRTVPKATIRRTRRSPRSAPRVS